MNLDQMGGRCSVSVTLQDTLVPNPYGLPSANLLAPFAIGSPRSYTFQVTAGKPCLRHCPTIDYYVSYNGTGEPAGTDWRVSAKAAGKSDCTASLPEVAVADFPVKLAWPAACPPPTVLVSWVYLGEPASASASPAVAPAPTTSSTTTTTSKTTKTKTSKTTKTTLRPPKTTTTTTATTKTSQTTKTSRPAPTTTTTACTGAGGANPCALTTTTASPTSTSSATLFTRVWAGLPHHQHHANVGPNDHGGTDHDSDDLGHDHYGGPDNYVDDERADHDDHQPPTAHDDYYRPADDAADLAAEHHHDNVGDHDDSAQHNHQHVFGDDDNVCEHHYGHELAHDHHDGFFVGLVRFIFGGAERGGAAGPSLRASARSRRRRRARRLAHQGPGRRSTCGSLLVEWRARCVLVP